MDRLDIRNYLYHGIHNGLYKGSAPHPGLAVFESILKDEYLLFGKELNERDVYSVNTCYKAETGLAPRISLGFYPLNEEIYEIARNNYKNKDYMPKNIRDLLINKYEVSADKLDSNPIKFHLDDMWFAWYRYYRGITLILKSELLNDLKISNCAALYDEICIDEKVSLRKYLAAVSICLDNYEALDKYSLVDVRKLKLEGYEYEELPENYLYIINLLKKYNYDVPVIDFLTGKTLDEHGKVLVRIKKNKQ